jgi:DNA-binding MarR family transcriptional regulator
MNIVADARETVRLSLRLITTSRLIEREVDSLMRVHFDSTIARFDFMAALDRHGALTLGEASQYLLVSNGNITQLRTRLLGDGFIETETDARDRRIQRVRLTPRGRSVFSAMAKAHAACVDRLLGDLSAADKSSLARLLDSAKGSIRSKLQREIVA